MSVSKTISFLSLAVIFAIVHKFAVTASLYWVYWWFDIFMHFWGGILITFGTYVICSFNFINTKPNMKIILFVLLIVAGVWEVFEWFAGLYEASTYLIDTGKDLIFGFSGGLFAYTMFRRYNIN